MENTLLLEPNCENKMVILHIISGKIIKFYIILAILQIRFLYNNAIMHHDWKTINQFSININMLIVIFSTCLLFTK